MKRVGLEGFFWRSLGRFPYDLGYPEFSDHRAALRAIGTQRCPVVAKLTDPAPHPIRTSFE